MRKIILITAIIFLLILSFNVKSKNNKSYLSSKIINDQLEYYRIDSEKEGPTVVITAGIHGDEPAGYHAALQLRKYRLESGEMYIFPAINNHGLKNNSRYYIDNIDLNRSFKGEKKGNKGERLAYLLFEFISQNADIVIDLHESKHFARENSDFYGQSIIAGTSESSIRYGMNVVSKINEEISKSKYQFILNSYPVKNSLIWSTDKILGVPSFMIETCKEMELEERINYQLKITKYLLIEAGVKIDEDKRN